MLNQIAEYLNQKVSGANATVGKGDGGDSFITVDSTKILAVCNALKNYDAFPFRALEVISGVDYKEYLEVVYVLATFHPEKNAEIILKVKLDRNNPELDSVNSVWKAANFQERECYDMFGVKFKNHPDLRRILCPEDWEGFPLRKDYEVVKFYNGIEVNPVAKMNIPDREFAAKQKAKATDAQAPAQ